MRGGGAAARELRPVKGTEGQSLDVCPDHQLRVSESSVWVEGASAALLFEAAEAVEETKVGLQCASVVGRVPPRARLLWAAAALSLQCAQDLSLHIVGCILSRCSHRGRKTPLAMGSV
jgi:hypothetical protein